MIAPPEEELPSPAALLLEDEDDLLEEEDFSYASMFASLTTEGEGDSLLEDLAITNQQQQQQQSSSFFMDSPLMETSKPKGSIGLGSLLVGPTSTLGSGGTLSQLTGVGGGMTPPPPSSSTGGVSGSSSMVAPPNAMTSEELEAQLLGRPSLAIGGAPQQQQQQQYPPPPPQMMMIGGPPGGPYPPPPHMMMMRPPPPPQGMMMHQPGVFTPDMIEAAASQQQTPPPQAWAGRPPPPHPQMMMMMPPPPPQQQQQPMPLGGGMMMMPRGPPGRAFGAPPPPNEQGGGYANLAQRLKALNLAEPHQEAAQQAVQQYHRHASMMQRRNNNKNNNTMSYSNQGGGRFGSKYMPGPEIESILSMQFRAVSGVPYTEDYYYQAFVYKYYEQRNTRVFAPESVRELNPTEKAAPGEVSFVKLEGLGKVPFSNIRRPRPLMDISTAPPPPDDGSGKKEGEDGTDGGNKDASVATTVRPLDQEPLLAARIMIEDCMCLVLDVLDVDAIFSAANNGQEIENVEALRTRRALLLEGLAASMRLPDAASVDEEAEKKLKKDNKLKNGEDDTVGTTTSIEAGDGVFLRLTTLPKGKALVARALKVIYPPPQSRGAVEGIEPNLRVLWAVMRNARALFGGRRGAAGKQEEDTTVSAKIAAAMIDTISKLHSPQALCSTLEAAMHGDLYVDGKAMKANPEAVLLPLTPPPASSSSSSGDKKEKELPWLKDVITALLTKAGEMDIKGSVGDSPGKNDSDEVEQWYKDTERLYKVVVRHLSALSEALEAAKKMKEKEAIGEVKAMVPVKMGETLLEHCGKKKRKELEGVLQKVTK